MTFTNFLAELHQDLRQYSESGLIEDSSVRLWVQDELKKFGNLITEIKDGFVEIKNNKGVLPEGFYSFYLATICNPTKQVGSIDDGSTSIQRVHSYTIRTEALREWDNQSQAFKPGTYKEVRETLFFDDGKRKVDFYYKPILLNITNRVLNSSCDKNCVNTYKRNVSPYEISSVQGKYVNTNFKNGILYIQYFSLPMDEDGDLIIPELSTNTLYSYLMYHCKRKVLEDLMLNEDDPSVINKIQYFLQFEREYFLKAMTDAKIDSVSGYGWYEGLKMRNKKRMRVYENFSIGK